MKISQSCTKTRFLFTAISFRYHAAPTCRLPCRPGRIPTGSESLAAVNGDSAIIPALIVAFLVFSTFIYLRYTKHGFEILVVGDSTQTAKYIGINVGHVLRRTMLVSGAICGFVGFLMVSNFDYTISSATDQGFGFTAIIVCWLANFNPFAMVGYSSLISFLNVGAENLKSSGYSPNLNEYSSEFISFAKFLFSSSISARN